MPWLKLDDGMGSHRKTRRLLRRNTDGLASFGLHALALLHCSEYLTDGFVEADFVEDTLDDARVRGKQRDSIVEALVKGGQWEVADGGWMVHGYLEHNPSREEVEARRANDRVRKAAAGRKGAAARWGSAKDEPGDSHGTVPSLSHGNDGSAARGVDSSRPVPSHTHPVPSAEEVPDGTSVEPTRLDRAQVIRQLFAYWQERCNRPRAQLTPERRKHVNARLDQNYTVDDIRRGIDGAALNPPRDGDVEYDDLVSICRNGAQLERYMARAGKPRPPGSRGFLDRLKDVSA